MGHHNPRHPHRHHARPKKDPVSVETPDNGYKGLFWLIVLGTAAVIGLGYCLSQPPLPPAPLPDPVIQEPPVPISGPTHDAAPIEAAPAPVKARKASHRRADDDEPGHHKRRHRDGD